MTRCDVFLWAFVSQTIVAQLLMIGINLERRFREVEVGRAYDRGWAAARLWEVKS